MKTFAWFAAAAVAGGVALGAAQSEDTQYSGARSGAYCYGKDMKDALYRSAELRAGMVSDSVWGKLNEIHHCNAASGTPFIGRLKPVAVMVINHKRDAVYATLVRDKDGGLIPVVTDDLSIDH